MSASPSKAMQLNRLRKKSLLKTQPNKRKRKSVVDNDDDFAEMEATKPTKKAGKKSKLAEQDEDTTEKKTSTKKTPKASLSKPKRTTTDSSWHADAAERRIAANERKVQQVQPGQAEKRLRT